MDKNKLHEEFVSGGVGDKPWVVPIQGLCGGILILMNYHIIRIFKLKLSGFPQLMFNFFIIIFPYTLLMTVLSNYLLEIFIVLSSILIFIQLSHSWKGSNVRKSIDKSFYYSEFDCLRACVLVPTAIAILAVDFKIFPRSWAKTEYFGYSVMDVGTSGSFMLMGIGDEILNEKNKTKVEVKVEKKFLKKLPSWFVLFVLGVIRMVFMIIFNYHSHVSEYGVHWNFFITMGCVALLSKAFAKYIGMKMLFLCLGLNYAILNLFGFQEWGLDNDASRTSIISANKEGIISLLGYFSIYVLYRIFGRYLLSIKKSGHGRYLPVTLETLIAPVIFFSLQLLSEHYLGEPSRRVFNIPFFFYTAGTTSSWFSLMVYAEKSSEELRNARKYKDLLYLLSKYGLYFFLLANLLTGLVNISIVTFEIDNSLISLSIITFYMYILAFFCYFMDIVM
uniref:Phosphatidylinositol-glycan biosynthesis class W protein n=1 Tax=Strongyloides papillosus TaxID=174720 RepID=A0A0N5CGT0_STREA